MTDVTSPAAVRMTISETTLSETILSMVPGNRFRMLLLMTRLVLTFSRILIRPWQIGGGSRFAASGILALSSADEKRDSDLVRH
jgi:hypothetical protein